MMDGHPHLMMPGGLLDSTVPGDGLDIEWKTRVHTRTGAVAVKGIGAPFSLLKTRFGTNFRILCDC
jgi:hypothetical protein